MDDSKPAQSEADIIADQPQPSGPLGILFPVDPRVWNQARKLIGDGNARVEDLATACSQDPAIVIELLRVANAMYFSGGRSHITTAQTAVVRLGSETIIELLDKLKDRPQITDPAVADWLRIHRGRCKRTAIVARLLAEALARNLSDDCQTAALLSNVGDMLAVVHFAEGYVKLAEQHARSGVNYRLAANQRFDVEKMGLNYLRRQGVPEVLLFAIDRDARSRSPEKSIMKPLCMAAGEIVDAFDADRWEKIAPGKTLSPKSAIRMLQMGEDQYLKIYERASEYLFAARILEEKTKHDEGFEDFGAEAAGEEDDDLVDMELESEIQAILASAPEEPEPAPEPKVKAAPQPEPEATQIHTVKETIPTATEQFGLSGSFEQPKKVARVEKTQAPAVEPPKLRTNKGNAVVTSIAGMFEEADNSEDLLKGLLEMLVDNGPFEKSALIVVSRDRGEAIVVAARGPIGNGQRISLDDPLSPLAQCFSKVQSFGNRENESSPFGSKAFALAPIDADHETPVALYADCGKNGSLSFEARRIFRTVVEILNQKLPEIPGGIPVELA